MGPSLPTWLLIKDNFAYQVLDRAVALNRLKHFCLFKFPIRSCGQQNLPCSIFHSGKKHKIAQT